MVETLKNSWLLLPSKQQRRTEAMLLLLSWLILWPLLNYLELCGLALGFALLAALLWSRRQAVTLSFDGRHWYLQRSKHTPASIISWRSGSVRRRRLIIFRYGFWPWQRLLIYPDRLANKELQLLLRILALAYNG